ncbi:hypothetical protein [Streptomyces tendae]|uniref:hypothetical protein n=1 Tax=Streptomyces tendae TaxID=1932 RepID=UPI003D720C4B
MPHDTALHGSTTSAPVGEQNPGIEHKERQRLEQSLNRALAHNDVDNAQRRLIKQPALRALHAAIEKAAARSSSDEYRWEEDFSASDFVAVLNRKGLTVRLLKSPDLLARLVEEPGVLKAAASHLRVTEAIVVHPELIESLSAAPVTLDFITENGIPEEQGVPAGDVAVYNILAKPGFVQWLESSEHYRHYFSEWPDVVVSVDGVQPILSELASYPTRVNDLIVHSPELAEVLLSIPDQVSSVRSLQDEYGLSAALLRLVTYGRKVSKETFRRVLTDVHAKKRLREHPAEVLVVLGVPGLLEAAVPAAERGDPADSGHPSVFDLLARSPLLTDVLEDDLTIGERLAADRAALTAAVDNPDVAHILSEHPDFFDHVPGDQLTAALTAARHQPLPAPPAAARETSAIRLRREGPGWRAVLKDVAVARVLAADPDFANQAVASEILYWEPHVVRRLMSPQAQDLRAELKAGTPPSALRIYLRHMPLSQPVNKGFEELVEEDREVREAAYRRQHFFSYLHDHAARSWRPLLNDSLMRQRLMENWRLPTAFDHSMLTLMRRVPGFSEVLLAENAALLEIMAGTDLYIRFANADDVERLKNAQVAYPGLMRVLSGRLQSVSDELWFHLLRNDPLRRMIFTHLQSPTVQLLLSNPEMLAGALMRPTFVQAWLDDRDVDKEKRYRKEFDDLAGRPQKFLKKLKGVSRPVFSEFGFEVRSDVFEVTKALADWNIKRKTLDERLTGVLRKQYGVEADIESLRDRLLQRWDEVAGFAELKRWAEADLAIAQAVFFRDGFYEAVRERPKILELKAVWFSLLTDDRLIDVLAHDNHAWHAFSQNTAFISTYFVPNSPMSQAFASNPAYIDALRTIGSIYSTSQTVMQLVESSEHVARAVGADRQILDLLQDSPELVETLSAAEPQLVQLAVSTVGRLRAVAAAPSVLSAIGRYPHTIKTLFTRPWVASDTDGFSRLAMQTEIHEVLEQFPERTSDVFGSDKALKVALAAPRWVQELDRASAPQRRRMLEDDFLDALHAHPSLVDDLADGTPLGVALVALRGLARAILGRDKLLEQLRADPALVDVLRKRPVLIDSATSSESAFWRVLVRHPQLAPHLNSGFQRLIDSDSPIAEQLLTSPLSYDTRQAGLLVSSLRAGTPQLLRERTDVATAFFAHHVWQEHAAENPSFATSVRELLRKEPHTFNELLTGSDPRHFLAALETVTKPAPARPAETVRVLPPAEPAGRDKPSTDDQTAKHGAEEERPGQARAGSVGKATAAHAVSEETVAVLAGAGGGALAAVIADSPELLEMLDALPARFEAMRAETDIRAYTFRAYLEEALPAHDAAFVAPRPDGSVSPPVYDASLFQPFVSDYLSATDTITAVDDIQLARIEEAARHTWQHVTRERVERAEQEIAEINNRLARFKPNDPDTWQYSGRVHEAASLAGADVLEQHQRILRDVAIAALSPREKPHISVNKALHAHLTGGSHGVSFFFALAPDGQVDTVAYALSESRQANKYCWQGGVYTKGPFPLAGIDSDRLKASRERVEQSRSRRTVETPSVPAPRGTHLTKRAADIAAALTAFHQPTASEPAQRAQTVLEAAQALHRVDVDVAASLMQSASPESLEEVRRLLADAAQPRNPPLAYEPWKIGTVLHVLTAWGTAEARHAARAMHQPSAVAQSARPAQSKGVKGKNRNRGAALPGGTSSSPVAPHRPGEGSSGRVQRQQTRENGEAQQAERTEPTRQGERVRPHGKSRRARTFGDAVLTDPCFVGFPRDRVDAVAVALRLMRQGGARPVMAISSDGKTPADRDHYFRFVRQVAETYIDLGSGAAAALVGTYKRPAFRSESPTDEARGDRTVEAAHHVSGGAMTGTSDSRDGAVREAADGEAPTDRQSVVNRHAGSAEGRPQNTSAADDVMYVLTGHEAAAEPEKAEPHSPSTVQEQIPVGIAAGTGGETVGLAGELTGSSGADIEGPRETSLSAPRRLKDPRVLARRLKVAFGWSTPVSGTSDRVIDAPSPPPRAASASDTAGHDSARSREGPPPSPVMAGWNGGVSVLLDWRRSPELWAVDVAVQAWRQSAPEENVSRLRAIAHAIGDWLESKTDPGASRRWDEVRRLAEEVDTHLTYFTRDDGAPLEPSPDSRFRRMTAHSGNRRIGRVVNWTLSYVNAQLDMLELATGREPQPEFLVNAIHTLREEANKPRRTVWQDMGLTRDSADPAEPHSTTSADQSPLDATHTALPSDAPSHGERAETTEPPADDHIQSESRGLTPTPHPGQSAPLPSKPASGRAGAIRGVGRPQGFEEAPAHPSTEGGTAAAGSESVAERWAELSSLAGKPRSRELKVIDQAVRAWVKGKKRTWSDARRESEELLAISDGIHFWRQKATGKRRRQNAVDKLEAEVEREIAAHATGGGQQAAIRKRSMSSLLDMEELRTYLLRVDDRYVQNIELRVHAAPGPSIKSKDFLRKHGHAWLEITLPKGAHALSGTKMHLSFWQADGLLSQARGRGTVSQNIPGREQRENDTRIQLLVSPAQLARGLRYADEKSKEQSSVGRNSTSFVRGMVKAITGERIPGFSNTPGGLAADLRTLWADTPGTEAWSHVHAQTQEASSPPPRSEVAAQGDDTASDRRGLLIDRELTFENPGVTPSRATITTMNRLAEVVVGRALRMRKNGHPHLPEVRLIHGGAGIGKQRANAAVNIFRDMLAAQIDDIDPSEGIILRADDFTIASSPASGDVRLAGGETVLAVNLRDAENLASRGTDGQTRGSIEPGQQFVPAAAMYSESVRARIGTTDSGREWTPLHLIQEDGDRNPINRPINVARAIGTEHDSGHQEGGGDYDNHTPEEEADTDGLTAGLRERLDRPELLAHQVTGNDVSEMLVENPVLAATWALAPDTPATLGQIGLGYQDRARLVVAHPELDPALAADLVSLPSYRSLIPPNATNVVADDATPTGTTAPSTAHEPSVDPVDGDLSPVAAAVLAEPAWRDLPPPWVQLALDTYEELKPPEILIGRDAHTQGLRAEFRDDIRRIVLAGLQENGTTQNLSSTSDLRPLEVERPVRERMIRAAQDVIEARETGIGLDLEQSADWSRYKELTDEKSSFRHDLKALVNSRMKAMTEGKAPVVSSEQITRAWQRLAEQQRGLPISQLSDRIAMVLRARQRAVMPGSGGGFEAEFTEIIKLPQGTARQNSGKLLAFSESGEYRIVVEEKVFYKGADGVYFRRPEDALAAGGKPGDKVRLAIPEFVSDPLQIHADEEFGKAPKAPVFDALVQLESDLSGISGHPGTQPTIPLRNLLSPEHKWVLTDLGSQTLVGPRAVNDWSGFHAHYTFGVPVDGMFDFLEHVRDYTWRDRTKGYYTKDHLSDGLALGTAVAERFFLWSEHRSGNLVDHPLSSSGTISALEADPSFMAVRGYMALFYDNVAALVQANVYEGLRKVNLAVLSRNSMADIFQVLPDPVKQFLKAESGYIMHAMEKRILARIKDFAGEYRRMRQEEPPSSIYSLPGDIYGDGESPSVGKYVADGLGKADSNEDPVAQGMAFGANDLDDLDWKVTFDEIPMVVVEVRSYGARHVESVEAERQYSQLETVVRGLYERAEERKRYGREDLYRIRQSVLESLHDETASVFLQKPRAELVRTALRAVWNVRQMKGIESDFQSVSAIVETLDGLDSPRGHILYPIVVKHLRRLREPFAEVVPSERSEVAAARALVDQVLERLKRLPRPAPQGMPPLPPPPPGGPPLPPPPLGLPPLPSAPWSGRGKQPR